MKQYNLSVFGCNIVMSHPVRFGSALAMPRYFGQPCCVYKHSNNSASIQLIVKPCSTVQILPFMSRIVSPAEQSIV